MGRKSKWEYLRAIYRRYREAAAALRGRILDEFCQVCGYHRKYAIRLLNGPPPQKPEAKQKVRSATYGSAVISILAAIWESAGYPCSSRPPQDQARTGPKPCDPIVRARNGGTGTKGAGSAQRFRGLIICQISTNRLRLTHWNWKVTLWPPILSQSPLRQVQAIPSKK